MPTIPYLAVSISDESGTPLSVSAIVLRSGLTVRRTFSSTSPLRAPLSGLATGKYHLSIALTGRPEYVFPFSLVNQRTGLTPRFEKDSPACCSLTQSSVATSSGDTEQVFTLAFTFGKAHSEVVLVAGWDYSGGADNVAYCETCRDDLYSGTTYRVGVKQNITKRINNATVVTFFDFKTGDRLRMVKGSSGWFEMDRVPQGSVKTHLGYYSSATSLRKRYLDDSISIKHVYDYIADIGSSAPGALRELHIFSHAWAGGPVLVNTDEAPAYQPGGADEGLRDPNDKDPRLKDFDLVNMPRLRDFKAAFAADAIAKIWGCLAAQAYRNLIRATSRATSDTTTISYDWDGSTVTMTAGEARDFLQRDILTNTYAARLAAAVGGGLKAYGAPPGMGADLRAVSVGKKKHNYMYVNTFTYKSEFAYLRRALGLVPDDTGYILY